MVPGISLLQIVPENDISQTCLFLVLVGETALFAAKISSSVKVANKTAVA